MTDTTINKPTSARSTGSAKAKEALEKITAATTEATAMLKDSFSTAAKGAQDYNIKVIEFGQTNLEASLDFAQKLSGVKSPSDFVELSTDHSRKQFETLAEQSKELAELAQKIVLAAAEPIKTGVASVFSQAA